MNPAKKQPKRDPPGSVAKCLEIVDPLERDKCIIHRLEQRIDSSVKKVGADMNEIAASLKRDFKAELGNKIDDVVMPVLKSADENAIGAISAYGGMVETMYRVGQTIDSIKEDIETIKRNGVTKDDLASIESSMATKDDLKAFATKEDLERFTTKNEMNALSSKIDGMDKKLDAALKK